MKEEVINYKKIAMDISTGYDVVFENEFPNAKEVIAKLKKKPKCGSCLLKNIPELFKQPNFKEKLELIYGKNSVFDLTPPTPPTTSPTSPSVISSYKQVADVLEFSEEAWNVWWKENSISPTKKFQHVATYYKPETKTVVATIVYYEK